MSKHDLGAVVDLETKAIAEESDSWTVTGFASVFNNKDLGGDVVLPGAFADTLKKDGMPLLLFNHKMHDDPPIGTVIECEERSRGLYFKAELPKDDAFVAGRIVPQIKRRGLKGVSIGYKALEKDRRREDGARLLKRLKLIEISIVNSAMNPLAELTGIKGLVPFQDLPVDRKSASWDAEAAIARIKARFGAEDEEFKRAFLHFDAEAGEGEDGNRIPDTRFLIADIDDSGRLVANQIALYKCASTVYGVRNGGLDLPEEAVDAVKGHLDRYYSRLDLGSPAQSLSEGEYKALSPAEREVRLRGLGISQRLAKSLVSGQRDADRSPAADFARLHEALFGLKDALSGIR